MPMSSEPLVQLGPMHDEYAEGVHHIEIIGENVRVVYFKRVLGDDGLTFQCVALDFAMVFPLRNLPPSIEQRFRVVRPTAAPAVIDAALH